MSIELEPITNECGGTVLAGIIKIEVIPYNDIDKFPELFQKENRLLSAIILKPTKQWLPISFTQNSGQLKAQLNRDSHNGFLKNVLEFTIPNESNTLSAQMNAYQQRLFVVKLTDKSGFIKILGSEINPCVFKYSFVSGKKVGDFKGYKVQIQQISKENPAEYMF